MSQQHAFIPYEFERIDAKVMEQRAKDHYAFANKRRSVRTFSNEDVPFEVIKHVVLSAGTAPSGAHKQPWTFCIVRAAELKKKIREAAEKEEYESYTNRMSDEWLEDLKPMATDWQKPFIETVPWIVVVFKRAFEYNEDGSKHQNYYVNESVGIACGMLIQAIHSVGLATLTHTPSPMNFLTQILGRPDNERPYLLLPVGYPASGTQVPKLERKSFEEMAQVYD